MNTRIKGLIKTVIGALVFSLILYWLVDQHHRGKQPLIEATLMAAPGALGLVGLIELITGTSFSAFAEAWSQLKGWQRGLAGVAVCSVTFLVIIIGFLWSLHWAP